MSTHEYFTGTCADCGQCLQNNVSSTTAVMFENCSLKNVQMTAHTNK